MGAQKARMPFECYASGARLRQVNAQLKSLDHLRGDFMSSVTHELRTPLTSIRALAELTRHNGDMPLPQRQQFVEIIVAATERLMQVTPNLPSNTAVSSGLPGGRSLALRRCRSARHGA